MLRDGHGIGGRALSEAGVDYERTRHHLEDFDRRPERGPSRQSFADSLKAILEKSLRVSMARGDHAIGTEHLLLGLLEQQDETTTRVFATLGVTEDAIVQRVEALLAENTQPVNPVARTRLRSAVAFAGRGDDLRRLEVLEGVLWGIDHLGEVIAVLRGSANRLAARDALMAPPFSLSQNQATGVLDLSVDSVTQERRQQVIEEIATLRRQISDQ
jgi:ATP-dependent Clp protease ATP-binding subunit ClpA